MHDAVVQTNFYLNFAWGADAVFLTPEAILHSAQSFVDGMVAVKDAPKQLDHVQSSAMSVYLLIMPRWNELTSYALNRSIPWRVKTKSHAQHTRTRTHV